MRPTTLLINLKVSTNCLPRLTIWSRYFWRWCYNCEDSNESFRKGREKDPFHVCQQMLPKIKMRECWSRKKPWCTGCVPAFGPNFSVGVEKVGHEVSSTGCEPAFKRWSIFLNFSPHHSCCTTSFTPSRPSLYSFSHHCRQSTPSTSNSSQKQPITSHLITFKQSCVQSTARPPTSDNNQHARLILLLSVLLFADLQKNEGAR